MENQGINQSRLFYGDNWHTEPAVPDQFSSAEWTLDASQDPLRPNGPRRLTRPYVQQTFLGCTIIDFNVNGGFGDSSSSLSVSLIQDEYNKSDGLPLGIGDDQYHNGMFDLFRAPPVGSPVFFKFGSNHATIPQAWIKTIDDIYGYNTIGSVQRVPRLENRITSLREGEEFVDIDLSNTPQQKDYVVWDYGDLDNIDNNYRGAEHFVFGGILQNYSQDSSTGGDPKYSVSVTDPREILSNTTMILNNYSNSTFDLPNLFNVFGFLEYNPTKGLRERIDNFYGQNKFIFNKIINTDGTITYRGGYDVSRNISYPMFTDAYVTDKLLAYLALSSADPSRNRPPSLDLFPNVFPYTGTSYSRRTDRGIPMYRVVQAMNSMMGFYGELPQEYELKKFGKLINFRGFNYVVDFGGLPINKIPPSYCLDFDQMNLLEFCQEVCDVTSHDFYVSLLPVINHPAIYNIHQYNINKIDQGKLSDVVVGVIRIDSIDRSKKPNYGVISSFIDILKANGSEIISSKEGFELSNVPTDKFVVGAQEVDMYFFTGNGDRDLLDTRKQKTSAFVSQKLKEQWFLSDSLRQQILPFYGFLGKDCVTIPRGYGSFQQILLDSSNLNANGVGNYYIATEMELRAAAVSYQSWKDFLMQYNNLYMESMDDDDALQGAILQTTTVPTELEASMAPYSYVEKYGVTVPRCVFRSDKNYVKDNGVPFSPCSPPYGYPLYYKRASSLGFAEAGVAGFSASVANILDNLQTFKNKDDQNFREIVNSFWFKKLKDDKLIGADPKEREIINFIKEKLANANQNDTQSIVSLIEEKLKQEKSIYQDISKTAEEQEENAQKVYNFVKSVANNLGTKFLVKIPKESNPFFSKDVGFKSLFRALGADEKVFEIENGPFGFKPRSISSDIDYSNSEDFMDQLEKARQYVNSQRHNRFNVILGYGTSRTGLSSLDLPSNSITEAIDASGLFDLTYGALKSEYDKISDTHVFNYEPEPQGGFFNYDLYKNKLSLDDINKIEKGLRPALLKNMLFPVDPTNFMNDNRISSYVRFDNSELLDFSSIPSDSFFQMAITDVGLVPGTVLDLANTSPDKFTSFSANSETHKELEKQPTSVAFLRCDLDAKFYLAPKIKVSMEHVYGREVTQNHKIKPAKRTWDSETQKDVFTLPIYEANFVPKTRSVYREIQEDFERKMYCEDSLEASGTLSIDYKTGTITDSRMKKVIGELIKTDKEDQDQNHVYALITLPGEIRSRIDQRFADGMFKANQGHTISHILTEDVVKNIPGFEEPAFKTGPDKAVFQTTPLKENDIDKLKNIFKVPDETVSSAMSAYKAAIKATQYSMNNVLGISMPSPKYPDMVALPLMSKERCYGPWISSYSSLESIRYKNIPGKVEFIKDESLSPWAYNGYTLMNEAGFLQAQFSNSLMLFSENGNISFMGLPSGNCLLRPLMNGGPLVTSIDITVDSSNGISTSYNMATYTPRFGNLQKQKSDLISRISRESQRLRDEKNNIIRKGLKRDTNYEARNISYEKTNNLSKFVQGLSEYAEKMQESQDLTHVPVFSTQDVMNTENNQVITHTEVHSSTKIENSQKKTIALATDSRQQINKNLYTTHGIPMEGVSRDVNVFIPNFVNKKESPIEDIDELFT